MPGVKEKHNLLAKIDYQSQRLFLYACEIFPPRNLPEMITRKYVSIYNVIGAHSKSVAVVSLQ